MYVCVANIPRHTELSQTQIIAPVSRGLTELSQTQIIKPISHGHTRAIPDTNYHVSIPQPDRAIPDTDYYVSIPRPHRATYIPEPDTLQLPKSISISHKLYGPCTCWCSPWYSPWYSQSTCPLCFVIHLPPVTPA